MHRSLKQLFNNFVMKCIENILYLLFSAEPNYEKRVHFLVRVSNVSDMGAFQVKIRVSDG